ncbi:2',5' RNA ligase family [Caulifigura coniformis]|uniref:RNA 2',3'-cyclic phosphodiesterase n=1 Tax=Caulifigura coniformis TaxID=2527983 RepID=A0A517SBZ4_9PLAN|nr:RNA 2',3'-cyclic phosphodiesterase [Caulifigura coniformis]QDT53649.1 2',5' RNA ligase family [Caulifigura coniformis]
MGATIRTFIGLRIAATDALRSVSADLGRMGRAVKITPADKFHLTLKFLGDTRRSQFDDIAAALRKASSSVSRHAIEIVGLGAFPKSARPAVVWAGVRPAGEIERLAAILDRLLEPLGFVPETRPYHPHLTLARVKGDAAGLEEVIEANRETPYGSATAAVAELFQSELTPGGSRYTSLATAELGPGG